MLEKVGHGYFAETEVGGISLRLSCIETGAGIAANVYSHKDDRWADAPMFLHNFEEAKSAATNRARIFLKAIGNLSLPSLDWKPIKS
jgi:hypothetical protein